MMTIMHRSRDSVAWTLRILELSDSCVQEFHFALDYRVSCIHVECHILGKN